MRTLRVPARWPPGAFPIALAGLFLASSAIAFVPTSRSYPGLSHLYDLAMKLLGSDGALKTLMQLALAAHGCEASYVLWLCAGKRVHIADIVPWCLLTALLGYPALFAVKEDLKAAAKPKKR